VEGSVGQRLQEPYVAALSNCFVWSLYGLYGAKTVNFSVLIVNGAGFIFYACYTFVMVRKGNSIGFGVARVVAGVVLTLLITGAFALGGCWFEISYGCNKAAIIGWSGAFLSFCMYLVPALQNFVRTTHPFPSFMFLHISPCICVWIDQLLCCSCRPTSKGWIFRW
jgi:hypothetical protein